MEIDNELRLKQEISLICQRYKKLIQEQKKDKEKLSMLVSQQSRQIVVLEKRRQILQEDNDKIFSDFSGVIDQDQSKKLKMSLQNSVILSKTDLSVINS